MILQQIELKIPINGNWLWLWELLIWFKIIVFMDLTLAQTTPINLNAVEATDLQNTVNVT